MALRRRFLLLLILIAATLATGSTAARRPRVDARPLPGWPFDLNDSGQVVGTFDSGPDRPEHAYLWERGRMTHLGSLTGHPHRTSAWARDINERGQIIGGAETRDGYSHAFLWEKGVMRDLGTLDGYYDSDASQINERGQIIGSAHTHDRSTVFIWEDGEMVDLGDHRQLFDLNNRGQVVGVEYGGWPGYLISGFIWENGRVTDLGADVRPFDLNDRGQVVGQANGRAFIWEDGRMTDIGVLPGDTKSWAKYIDERGRVLVQSGDSSILRHAFLWESGVRTDLGSLGGGSTFASAMNASGQIVGDTTLATTPTDRAFLWQDGVMLNLHRVRDPLRPAGRGIVLRSAHAINNRGQILCFAHHRGRWKYYLVSVY